MITKRAIHADTIRALWREVNDKSYCFGQRKMAVVLDWTIRINYEGIDGESLQ